MIEPGLAFHFGLWMNGCARARSCVSFDLDLGPFWWFAGASGEPRIRQRETGEHPERVNLRTPSDWLLSEYSFFSEFPLSDYY